MMGWWGKRDSERERERRIDLLLPGTRRMSCVMVIDDSIVSTKMAVKRLNDAGFHTNQAGGGDIAIQLLRQVLSGLVLSSICELLVLL